MITVTKTWLPPQDRYLSILNRAWQKGWITNNGELVLELEAQLRKQLEAEHCLYTSNGTVALQIALKTLGQQGGEIITTPYSYVATSHSIVWEGFTPVFADIEPDTYGINPLAVEAAITPDTKAILATHVYGIPCQTTALQAIGHQYNIPVIYDGAHAFGCKWQGKSLLSYGNISTCSFHATKIFHTVEGGCIVTNSQPGFQTMEGYRQFGHKGDEHYSIGINGKNSELHAAMGLAMLPHLPELIAERKQLFETYEQALAGMPLRLFQPNLIQALEWNYAYFPVLFNTEKAMLSAKKSLEANSIFPRRYFYPALHTLPFYTRQAKGMEQCSIAQDVASRMLCFPFYNNLSEETIWRIAGLVRAAI